MNTASVIFYFFLFAAAFAALGILLIKNIYKAALLLLVCLLSIAAIYVLSFAEFVAVTQILIYAGGVLVVIIFGIMLTSKIAGRPLVVTHSNIFPGAVLSVSMLILLISLFAEYSQPRAEQAIPTTDSIRTIGKAFVTTFSLPFEIAGILLLISLIGAAVITSFMKSKKL
jgi:NADH-quinone oxidoreductase subunit J